MAKKIPGFQCAQVEKPVETEMPKHWCHHSLCDPDITKHCQQPLAQYCQMHATLQILCHNLNAPHSIGFWQLPPTCQIDVYSQRRSTSTGLTKLICFKLDPKIDVTRVGSCSVALDWHWPQRRVDSDSLSMCLRTGTVEARCLMLQASYLMK